jgi:hypothetical protein
MYKCLAFLVLASIIVLLCTIGNSILAQAVSVNSVNQLSNDNAPPIILKAVEKFHNFPLGIVLLSLLTVCFFASDAKRLLKYLAPCILLFTGCMRPYDTPQFEDVGTSETAFLIPLQGDVSQQRGFASEDFLRQKMIATKRVQIPHEWVQDGRSGSDGHYMQTVRLIKIDRAPITREWTASASSGTSNHDQGIWVESKDSIGFSTGISLTARIENEEDAIKFLYNYPSGSLGKVLDTEGRARVQKVFSQEAAKFSMDALRGQKNQIVDAIQADMEPFFKQRGITITTIGLFGGFTYENAKSQEAIDKVFQAQQDQEVAKAEAQAQEERNKAVRLKALGLAEANRQDAQGTADAIKTVADAKAYELSKVTANADTYLKIKGIEVELERLKKWDGHYPATLFEGQSPLLTMPAPK